MLPNSHIVDRISRALVLVPLCWALIFRLVISFWVPVPKDPQGEFLVNSLGNIVSLIVGFYLGRTSVKQDGNKSPE